MPTRANAGYDGWPSTYATRLSAGGVADEWVTPVFHQGDTRRSLRSTRK